MPQAGLAGTCACRIPRNESASARVESALRTTSTLLGVGSFEIGRNRTAVRLFGTTLRPTIVVPRPAADELTNLLLQACSFASQVWPLHKISCEYRRGVDAR